MTPVLVELHSLSEHSLGLGVQLSLAFAAVRGLLELFPEAVKNGGPNSRCDTRRERRIQGGPDVGVKCHWEAQGEDAYRAESAGIGHTCGFHPLAVSIMD